MDNIDELIERVRPILGVGKEVANALETLRKRLADLESQYESRKFAQRQAETDKSDAVNSLAAANAEIERLNGTLREADERLDAYINESDELRFRLKIATSSIDNVALHLNQKLSAAQAEIGRLREALTKCCDKKLHAHIVAEKALSLPSDTTALHAYVKDIEQSRDWYKRRVDLLQEWQSKMRDPERTIVCDIIANGLTMEEGGRYSIDKDTSLHAYGKRIAENTLKLCQAKLNKWHMHDTAECLGKIDIEELGK